jgi:phage tail-like protein
MPGIQTLGNVTMKRGVFESDNQGWASLNEIAMNTIMRVPVTISLLDEHGSATMVWTLVNAWPAKITSTDLKADGNEVAVDTLGDRSRRADDSEFVVAEFDHCAF